MLSTRLSYFSEYIGYHVVIPSNALHCIETGYHMRPTSRDGPYFLGETIAMEGGGYDRYRC